MFFDVIHLRTHVLSSCAWCLDLEAWCAQHCAFLLECRMQNLCPYSQAHMLVFECNTYVKPPTCSG